MICSNHVDVSEGVRACARCGRPFCADCVVNIQGRSFCATCKGEKLLDIQSGSDASTLRFASIGRRFAAQWIDGIIFMIPIVIVFGITLAVLLARNSPQAPDALPTWFIFLAIILVAAFFFGFMAYEALMLSWRGQTLGKMALHIRVVRPDGAPISRGQAWGRALTRGVMVHLLALVNYLPALFTVEKTCVHDMAARTRVVSAE
ncbi:MAG: domain containing protein [Acidobacteria bacterium]|nr:domain containing protein [Acidobacteriota bacterium]